MLLLLSIVQGDYISNLYPRTPGVIQTIVGNSAGTTTATTVGSTGDGGPGTSALFSSITGVYMDSVNGYLYLSSDITGVVRRISMSTNGLVETVAGTAGTMSSTGDHGPATSAGLNSPSEVIVDIISNSLLIADQLNYAIRRVDLGTGIMSTYVGQLGVQYTTRGQGGVENGVGATLVGPTSMAFHSNGNLFIADTLNGNGNGISLIRIVDRASLAVSTYAGSITASSATFVGDNVAGIDARFLNIQGIATDAYDTLWAVDQTKQVLLKISSQTPHTVTIFGGGGTIAAPMTNMLGTTVVLNSPIGVGVDSLSNIYVSCYAGATGTGGVIRVFDQTGYTHNYAGVGTSATGYSGNGGQAVSATLMRPKKMSFDADDNLFFADMYNAFATLPQSIRVVFSGKVHFPRRGNYGYMTQLAGTGFLGSTGDGGPASLAKFSQVSSVAVDESGNIYTGESYGHVRMINSTTGYISRVAGNGTGPENGAATNSPLWRAPGITIDTSRNLYVADYMHCIRKLDTTTGLIQTIIGKRFTPGITDGVAGNQLLNHINSILSCYCTSQTTF